MKKMITLLSTAALALTFSLFASGCTEHKAMDTMGAKTDTMQNTTMDGMQNTGKQTTPSMDKKMKNQMPGSKDTMQGDDMKQKMPESTPAKGM